MRNEGYKKKSRVHITPVSSLRLLQDVAYEDVPEIQLKLSEIMYANTASNENCDFNRSHLKSVHVLYPLKQIMDMLNT